MVGYTKELKQKLSAGGCAFFGRSKGDHDVWVTPSGKKITVDANIKSRHTANEVLKQAGLPKSF